MAVVDGTGYVLGRAAAQIAKRLLAGEEISLVNSGEMIVSGEPKAIAERYMARRRVRNKMNPENSPKWPRVPHMLVRRIIRGMLPYDRKRGREAFRRLRVYSGIPGGLSPDTKLANAEASSLRKSVSVQELCRMLGYS